MAQEYKLLLSAQLDESKLQTQITAMQKQFTFNLKVKLDFSDIENQIKLFQSQLGEIQKKIQQAVQNVTPTSKPGTNVPGAPAGIAKITDAYNEFDKILKSIDTDFMKISSYNFGTRMIDGAKKATVATVAYTDSLGKAQKVMYYWNEEELRWVEGSNKLTDSLEKRNRILDAYQNKIDNFKARSADLGKSSDVENALTAAGKMQKIIDGLRSDTASPKQIQEGVIALRELNKEFDRNVSVVNQSGKAQYSWTKEIGIAIKRTIEWSFSIGLVYGAMNQLREGVQYIKDLNKELVNIQVVTGMSTASINKLAGEYNNLARQLGVTTKEITSGSLEWLFSEGHVKFL